MKQASWWLVLLFLAFFGMSGAQAAKNEASFHVVQAGETLRGIAGSNWRAVCKANSLKNCNKIRAGQKIWLVKSRSQLAQMAAPAIPQSGVFRWVRVGGAPLHHCGGRDDATINREAWQKLGLSEAEQVELEQKIARGQHKEVLLKPGKQFQAAAFCEKGKVSFKYNVVAAWKPDVVVSARTYVLSDRRILHWVRNCNNWVLDTIVLPPVMPEAEEEPQAAPQEPEVVEEVSMTVIAQRYDYDLALYAGADPHVRFGGGEGAFFPLLTEVEDGRHALGIGAKGDWWSGKNTEGFRYNGSTLTVGPAYKWSGKDGRDVNVKLLAGRVRQEGRQGDYKNHQLYGALCLATNYTDASRERVGEEAFPEWSAWANYCHLVAKSFGHSWQGNSIADTSELGKSRALISVGTRVYVHKNLETLSSGNMSGTLARGLQPFVELGGNAEVPHDPTGHAYVGVRTDDKIWTAGVGVHFGPEGTVPGFAVTFDAGRAIKLADQETRWQATLQGLEEAGIAID